jgi:hypothetical protein
LPRMLIIKLKQGGFEQGYEWEDWYEAECEIRTERHYWAKEVTWIFCLWYKPWIFAHFLPCSLVQKVMTHSEASALAHQSRHLLNIVATVRYISMNCRSFEKSENVAWWPWVVRHQNIKINDNFREIHVSAPDPFFSLNFLNLLP